MNTLAQEHYSAALLGSPPGYVGSKEGHTLLNKEKIKGDFSHPGIVLFDEIEKADTKVIRSIMNILDTGKLTLTSGQDEIDFTNSLIFMTSNLGAKAISTLCEDEPLYKQLLTGLLKRKFNLNIIDNDLTDQFDPEFINRIDYILMYQPLTQNHLEGIVHLEIQSINKRLRKNGRSVSISDKCVKSIIDTYDSRYGARDISRSMKQNVLPVLARSILENPDKQDFVLKSKEGKVNCEVYN